MWAQPIFPWTFNNTGMHVLSFGSQFAILSCFILGKCSMNHPSAYRPIGEDKWAGNVLTTLLWNILKLKLYTLQEFLYFGVNLGIVEWFDVRTVHIWFWWVVIVWMPYDDKRCLALLYLLVIREVLSFLDAESTPMFGLLLLIGETNE